MFWLKKTYTIPSFDESVGVRVKAFADKNEFDFNFYSQGNTIILKKPEKPAAGNMFSFLIQIDKQAQNCCATVSIRPNYWFICLMLFLVALAIACIADESMRKSGGISFPLLVVIPYIYHLYANKLQGDLKACLIPDYEKTSEGRKEVYVGYTKPLRFFLNFQRNAYILFVIVFIAFMLLWMFGVTDRFLAQP